MNEFDDDDSSDDEIFVYNKATLTSWKQKAVECEQKRKEQRAQALKRQNDRRKAKMEMERLAKVSLWRTDLRKHRKEAVNLEGKKLAAARALALKQELEQEKLAAEARKLKKREQDKVLLARAIDGTAITRRAFMLKARHDSQEKVQD